jgi:hypothetical protein
MGPAAGPPSLPQACALQVCFVLNVLMFPSSGHLKLVVFHLDTTAARVGAESKGKVPASPCPSQDLLVHVPYVSPDPAKYSNISFVHSNCCFLCEVIGSFFSLFCAEQIFP